MPPTPLSSRDQEVVDAMAVYFSRMGATAGLPKSAALIYHALFVSEQPLSFGQVMEQGGLSKATASTGLKLLERIGAAHRVEMPTERGTYYRPELSVRRLIAGFFENTLQPGLQSGSEILEGMNGTDGLSEHLESRVKSLKHWHAMSEDLLPVLKALEP
ncbi:GbsR/MarR family transcriptional regulator [Haloferula chungangensis]|uniref:GbsR/MarR family transcriptional regulator n=1 Tax=Haloferula chungangensis TaxID=1048331 RepID=A0ABW2L939_9BACT